MSWTCHKKFTMWTSHVSNESKCLWQSIDLQVVDNQVNCKTVTPTLETESVSRPRRTGICILTSRFWPFCFHWMENRACWKERVESRLIRTRSIHHTKETISRRFFSDCSNLGEGVSRKWFGNYSDSDANYSGETFSKETRSDYFEENLLMSFFCPRLLCWKSLFWNSVAKQDAECAESSRMCSCECSFEWFSFSIGECRTELLPECV